MITFYDYLDVINCNLDIKRYHNQNERWMAMIENAEVRTGTAGLLGTYGSGKSSDEAIQDYLKIIKGQLLIINAMSKEYRREFTVPENIIFKEMKS